MVSDLTEIVIKFLVTIKIFMFFQKNSDDDDDDWCHSTYDRQTKPIFKQLLNSNSDNRQRIKDYRTQSIERKFLKF